MVPTSALRETLILVLFGIILVPIAAKRAQDARGYWQTFQQLHPHKDLAVATTTPSSPSTSVTLDVIAPPPPPIIQCVVAAPQQQNETSFPAAAVHHHARSASPRGGGTTIRFGNGAAAEMTVAGSGEGVVMATAAPRIPVSSLRAEADDARRTRLLRAAAATKSTAAPTTTAPATVAKVSDASSKGRWTLIWMGSAIATVAGLMSLC